MNLGDKIEEVYNNLSEDLYICTDILSRNRPEVANRDLEAGISDLRQSVKTIEKNLLDKLGEINQTLISAQLINLREKIETNNQLKAIKHAVTNPYQMKAYEDIKIGHTSLKVKDYETAIKHYLRSIDNKPSHTAYIGLANAYISIGNFNQALESIDKAFPYCLNRHKEYFLMRSSVSRDFIKELSNEVFKCYLIKLEILNHDVSIDKQKQKLIEINNLNNWLDEYFIYDTSTYSKINPYLNYERVRANLYLGNLEDSYFDALYNIVTDIEYFNIVLTDKLLNNCREKVNEILRNKKVSYIEKIQEKVVTVEAKLNDIENLINRMDDIEAREKLLNQYHKVKEWFIEKITEANDIKLENSYKKIRDMYSKIIYSFQHSSGFSDVEEIIKQQYNICPLSIHSIIDLEKFYIKRMETLQKEIEIRRETTSGSNKKGLKQLFTKYLKL